ncbi:hypothetical protein AYO38_01040 [bacterium SCGC AG-212-C10]|nr:hypothetical protein AYO38_01040 [bacterium SCGC AG-212-C10]
MRKKQHPLSGAIYSELGDGLVRVDKNGQFGIFRGDGRYVEGELTFADQHMLNWVGGPALAPRRSAPTEMVTD